MNLLHASIATIAPSVLLAAANRKSTQIGQRVDGSGSGFGLYAILISMVAIGLLGLTIYLLFRWRRMRADLPYHNARALFHELCGAHQLSSADRRLLRDMAEWHELPTPALLFVEPDRFDVPEMIADLQGDESLTRLKSRLFAMS